MKETIGTRIKYALGIRGINQQELADKCEISRQYLSSVCRGVRNPSKGLVARMCKEMKISREWLLYGSGPMEEEPEAISDAALMTAELVQSDPKSLKRMFAMTIAHLSEKDLMALKTVMDAFIEEEKKTGDE